MSPTATVTIETVTGNERVSREDAVVVEAPLTIRVNGEPLSVTLRTPGHDTELALGFLVAEGVLSTPDMLLEVRASADNLSVALAPGPTTERLATRLFPTHSSCGLCGRPELVSLSTETPPALKGQPIVSPATLYRLDPAVRTAQAAFATTGGLHAAALFTADGTLLQLREDIGRHNAVDKLLGWAFQAGAMPLSQALLFLSGRVSFELVQKAARAGIPVIAAIGAPSSLAVELCREWDITLLGFVRGERFNIYAGEWRVATSQSSGPAAD